LVNSFKNNKGKNLKRLTVVSLIIVFLATFVSQSQTFNNSLTNKSSYKNGKIVLNDFSIIKCSDINIKSDSISFYNINKQLNESIGVANIYSLKVKEGNNALKWAIYGALTCGFVSVMRSYEYQEIPNKPKYIAACTLSGAAIGGFIGLLVPKWKTYYFPNNK